MQPLMKGVFSLRCPNVSKEHHVNQKGQIPRPTAGLPCPLLVAHRT